MFDNYRGELIIGGRLHDRHATRAISQFAPEGSHVEAQGQVVRLVIQMLEGDVRHSCPNVQRATSSTSRHPRYAEPTPADVYLKRVEELEVQLAAARREIGMARDGWQMEAANHQGTATILRDSEAALKKERAANLVLVGQVVKLMKQIEELNRPPVLVPTFGVVTTRKLVA